MSEEIQDDVADAYMQMRKNIEADMNERLSKCTLATNIVEWAFIAIVRPNDHPNYQEVKKKHSRQKELEFRLKVSYRDFLVASEVQKIGLIIDALARSVDIMAEFGVSAEDREKLSKMLGETEKHLLR